MAESPPETRLGNPDLPRQATLLKWFAFHAALLLAASAGLAALLPRQDDAFRTALAGFSEIARTVHPWWKMLAGQAVQAGTVFAAAGPGLKLLLLAAYLSLCTTFLPMPTSPAVAMAATGTAAFTGNPIILVLGLALVAGGASTVANLTDYHVFLWLLRSRHIARIRNTGVYRLGARWFAKAPFMSLIFFNIVHIPIDIPRMLSAIYGYRRRNFAAANLVGRVARYAAVVIIVLAMGPRYDWIAPWAFLGLAAALLAGKFSLRLFRRASHRNATFH